MRRLAAALTLVALVGLAPAPPTRYAVADGSRFWIDGTATTGAWTCEARTVGGRAELDGARRLDGEVVVPVRAFDCGSRPMTRDLRNALGAAAHPDVRYVLDGAEALASEPRPGAWVPVRAVGTLRLAGATRRVAVTAEGRRRADGRVDVRGRLPLRMTDFGVEPPAHALGLVRAHDAITVRFDLVAAPR